MINDLRVLTQLTQTVCRGSALKHYMMAAS